MSNERYPNIMSVFGFLDGLLGCVFGLLNFFFWLSLVAVVVSLVGEIFT